MIVTASDPLNPRSPWKRTRVLVDIYVPCHTKGKPRELSSGSTHSEARRVSVTGSFKGGTVHCTLYSTCTRSTAYSFSVSLGVVSVGVGCVGDVRTEGKFAVSHESL